MTSDIHKGLELKVNDSENSLLLYSHAADWVKEEFGVGLKYNTLGSYMKRHFKTKLNPPKIPL